MRTHIRYALVVLVSTLVACGGPPPSRLDRLYRGLSENLPRIDPAILEGRKIVVDPGHGGYFRGTTGRDSLEESGVNLGVSLYLWGLLREAGANVYLTRSIDRDFLTAEDSTLATDLRRRVAIADSLEPDIFISIHHNAQPARDPGTNQVETYYRAGDPASLDLAFAVHRHLIRNLGIESGEVRQGNYLVLRESKAPAILGESSYLTHPGVEKKLKLSEIQKLEAEAYFLGILEYFGRGIPRVERLAPVDSVYASIPTFVFALKDDGGSGIDPDGVSLRLDGAPVQPVLDRTLSRASWRPRWDAANGVYELSMSARNLGGNTSRLQTIRFAIDFPPEIATFETTPRHISRAGGALRLRARLLDRRGLVIADGTPAAVVTSASRDTTYARVRHGAVETSVFVATGDSPFTARVLCRGLVFETRVDRASDSSEDVRPVVVIDAVTGAAVLDAAVVSGDSLYQSGSETGVYFRPASVAEDSVGVWCRAHGYRPALVGSRADTLALEPWYGGVLQSLRFVLDPEGGRPRECGVGPLGLSGSHTNLLVARYLAGFLRAVGADVRMTRTNEEQRSPEDIALLTNRFRADRYIEIRHRSAPEDSAGIVRTYHFPGSAKGSQMAASVLEILSRRLSAEALGPFETVTYPLQQTACPAIVVSAPAISDPAEELRLAQSWYQREQAYAIFLGVLTHYGAYDSTKVVVDVPGSDPTDWRVTVDDTWTLVTGDDGRVSFESLDPGPHRVSAYKGPWFTTAAFYIASGETTKIALPRASKSK